MIEIKDDPRFPKGGRNTLPLYAAVWTRDEKEIGSGWRNDKADVIALAERMGGYVVRGYFVGAAL